MVKLIMQRNGKLIMHITNNGLGHARREDGLHKGCMIKIECYTHVYTQIPDRTCCHDQIGFC